MEDETHPRIVESNSSRGWSEERTAEQARPPDSAGPGEQVRPAQSARPAGQARPLAAVPDDALLRRLTELLAQSRRVEKDLIAHIEEVDARRLYAREAFPSMFAYCTDALHLSEGEAHLRIAVARASRQHPVLLELLGEGRLHLSGIALLAPHLTPENRNTLLQQATHKTKRQIEELIAAIAPRADVPSLIRKLPERATPASFPPATLSGMGSSVTQISPCQPDGPQSQGPGQGWSSNASEGLIAAPAALLAAAAPCVPGPAPCLPVPAPRLPAAVVQPLSPGRYKVQFTASAALRDKLERLRALMRSQIADGDLAGIIEVAVTEKLERLEARRFASTSRPRSSLSETDTSPRSRYISAAIRRAVRERDGNQCRYVDAAGRRCRERHRLEYHHLHTFGLGGGHDPANIRLMCKMHNRYLAECDYGREAMARFERPRERTGGRATASGAVAAPPGSMTASPGRL